MFKFIISLIISLTMITGCDDNRDKVSQNDLDTINSSMIESQPVMINKDIFENMFIPKSAKNIQIVDDHWVYFDLDGHTYLMTVAKYRTYSANKVYTRSVTLVK
jgi:hypothetical protein